MNIKAIDLINFGKMSELLTGRNDVVRANRIQKKHKDKVKELTDLVEYWQTKHGLR